MIYLGILLIFIGILVKKQIILSTVTKFGRVGDFTASNNSISTGIFIVATCIILISLLEKFSENFAVSKIYNTVYISVLVITAILILIIIIYNYRSYASVVISFLIISAVGLLIFFTVKQPKLEVSSDELAIKSIFSYKTNVSEIDSVWISGESIIISRKLSGVDLANYYRGKFNTSNSGNIVYLFIDKSKKSAIHILLKDNTEIVYNNKTEEETYSDLVRIQNLLKSH